MSVRVEINGTKEAKQLLRSLEGKELQNRTRRATRRGAGVFRAEVRKRARSSSEIPNFFAKTKTRGHRSPIGTSTGPTSPLLNIFEEGAARHTIAPGYAGSGRETTVRPARGGRFTGHLLLSGRAGKRWRSRDFVAGEPVSHPGMSARPFVGPIFDAKQDEASELAMDEMLRGLR